MKPPYASARAVPTTSHTDVSCSNNHEPLIPEPWRLLIEVLAKQLVEAWQKQPRLDERAAAASVDHRSD